MQPVSKKRFWGAVAAIIAVAVIAALVVLSLRYVAPETAPVNKPDSASESESTGTLSEPSTSNNDTKDGAPELQKVTINISDMAYDPALITVQRGTTVTWINDDSTEHTVTADTEGRGPDSGVLSKGETYSYTFEEAGKFSYHCKLHSDMKAVVQVVE